jgi:general secretion pathway protein J
MKNTRGFTLLELLVAISIFAIISAMAYGGLTRVLQDRDRLEVEHEFWRALSLTFARLEEDLSQTRSRTIRDVVGFDQPALRGQPTDTRAMGWPSLEFTRGGVLTFDAGARSDMQRVGYRLVEGTLQRLLWPVLDRAPDTKPLELPLIKNVESFQVRFYSPSGVWLDEWPPGGANDPPPRGVEVKLTLTGRGEFTRLFLVNG